MRRFSCTWNDAGGNGDGNVDDGELSALGSAGTVANSAFSIDVDLAEGSHKVVAKQTDVAGNVSAASVLDITVDETAPATISSMVISSATGAQNDTLNRRRCCYTDSNY